MVRIVAAQDTAQPGALFRDGLMPMPPESVLDLRQLGPHPFLTGIASQLEPSRACDTTDMGEPEKRKRFRFPLTPPGTIAGRKPPEFDETGLLRMELQGKRGETFGERGEKALGILPVLETHDGVIGIAGHDDHPLGVASPPLMHPEVQCIMQIDIGKQWRTTAPCTTPLSGSLTTSSSNTPAFSHLRIRRNRRRSPMRCWRNRSSQARSQLSNPRATCRSRTHSL